MSPITPVVAPTISTLAITSSSTVISKATLTSPEQLRQNWTITKVAIETQINVFNQLTKEGLNKEKLKDIGARVTSHIESFDRLKKEVDTAKKFLEKEKKFCGCLPSTIEMKRLAYVTVVCFVITVVALLLPVFLSDRKDLILIFGILGLAITNLITYYSTQISMNVQTKSDLETLNETAIKDGKKMLSLIKSLTRLLDILENKASSSRQSVNRISSSFPPVLTHTNSALSLPPGDDRYDVKRPSSTNILLPSVASELSSGSFHDRKVADSEIEIREKLLDETPPEELVKEALIHYRDLESNAENTEVQNAIVNLGVRASNDPYLIRHLPELEALGERVRTSIIQISDLPKPTNYGLAEQQTLLEGESLGSSSSNSSGVIIRENATAYSQLLERQRSIIQRRFGVTLTAIETPAGYLLDDYGAKKINVSINTSLITSIPNTPAPVTVIHHGEETPRTPSVVQINIENDDSKLPSLPAIDEVVSPTGDGNMFD